MNFLFAFFFSVHDRFLLRLQKMLEVG